jgi:hypothetical protein
MRSKPSTPLNHLDKDDAIKTYRYLRIGMIGAVVALGVSILIEWSQVDFDCLQTSISAYYYTPVRAVFVGSMIAVGFALIVYKGRSSREDVCLNFAGIFAPVVAIAPTTDVGWCWSNQPGPPPEVDGTLAPWLVANINNNMRTLLWTGLAGLILSFILVIVVNWKSSRRLAEGIKAPFDKVRTGTWISLLLTAVLLAVGLGLLWLWNDFYTRAHGFAALLFFVFLWFAIAFNVWEHRKAPEGEQDPPERTVFLRLYAAVALLMVAGFVMIPVIWGDSQHKLLWLEAWEIVLFAAYWILQTAENWDERVVDVRVVSLPDLPVHAPKTVG